MTVQQWLGLAIQASIVLTVFGLGLTANTQDVTYLFRRPAQLARAVLSMSIIMPVIAVLIATTVSLPFQVRIVLMALAVSPLPPILHKKQLAAGGREEYVVGLLVAMSILAIVLVPLTVTIFSYLFERQAFVTVTQITKIMLVTVLLPLGAGVLVQHLIPAAAKATPAIRAVAGILLIGGVVVLIFQLWPIARTFLGNGVVLMLAVLALLGLAVGHFLGGPDDGDRAALALSTSSRHPGVALAIATSGPLGQSKPALAVILLYVVVATIVAIPYQRWRVHRASTTLRATPEQTPADANG